MSDLFESLRQDPLNYVDSSYYDGFQFDRERFREDFKPAHRP